MASRRKTRARLVALFVGLLLVAVGGIVATAVTLSQQEQIRLAASNSGEFELRLHPFRLHADGTRESVPASDEIRWSLSPAPVSRSAGADDAKPYQSDLLERTALGVVDGSARWRVRVPAAPALLRAQVGRCPESVLRLEALPGYERSSHELHVVDVPLPLCADEGMATVAAGPFVADDGGVVELPAFAIDRFEVTAARFESWVALASMTGEDPVPLPEFARADPQLPTVAVTAVQAEAFCRYLGRRLPTSNEWLKAGRGGLVLPDGGENPAPGRSRPWLGDGGANWAMEDPFPELAPVGRFPDDVSPYGVFDLAGNVTEWTATPAASQALRGLRILRGGNWDTRLGNPDNDIEFANARPALAVDYGLGFRCAATITPDGG